MKDNYGLFLDHEAEMEKKLMKMPVCACCKEHIQDEYLYRIAGKIYCESCIESMRESIED